MIKNEDEDPTDDSIECVCVCAVEEIFIDYY